MQGSTPRKFLFVNLGLALCVLLFSNIAKAEDYKTRIDYYSRKPLSITPTPFLTPTPTNTIASIQDYHAFNMFQTITIGRERAQTMIKILQDQEMRKALQSVTAKGSALARENPELASPAMVLAGAAAVWVGRTFTILRVEDMKFSSRLSGRERSGEFNMESPLMNGQLKFDQGQGINVGVNRTVSSIDSRAELSFNTKRQAVSTQLYHRVAPNLDLSVGASQNFTGSQTEGTAKIQYQIDF